MNRPVSRTSAIRSFSSALSGAYCALTSTSGICGTAAHLSHASPTEIPDQQREDTDSDERLDVAEVVVERLPARAERPARARDPEAPRDRAQHRVEREVAERHAREPRRDRDERAHDGGHAAEEDGPVAPAVEPALGAVEVLRPEMEPASVSLDERTPAVEADRPADDRADGLAGYPRRGDRDVAPEVGVDLVAEQDDVLAGQGARGEDARIEHHELARGRKDRVDQHQREHGVQPVVADEVGQGAREGGQQHRPDPSWLALRSLHQEAPLELARPERVRGLHARRVRAREGTDAVAVQPVPADRAAAGAEAAPNRLYPPATRVADRQRHDRRVGEAESHPERSSVPVDDDACRPYAQVAERPVQVEAPLDLRLLALVVECVDHPAPPSLRFHASLRRASRPRGLYVPGSWKPVSVWRGIPSGPIRLPVTVEGRTSLKLSVCVSATPSPLGESTGLGACGTMTP